jgi:sigma-E factor negative regulatory protein RseA
MITQRQESIDSSVNMPLESLSACMDGELSAKHRDELLAQFEDDALQTEWSLYHCIGDVLRSDELSCHSDGFNKRFSALLAAEPHVLAPESARAVAAAQERARKSRWIKPLSLAASMAAVAVVAGVAMQQWNSSSNMIVADVKPGTQRVATVEVPAGATLQPVVQTQPMQVPNAYLNAHRQYGSQRTSLYVQTVAHDSGSK